jgi:hypothetical protein
MIKYGVFLILISFDFSWQNFEMKAYIFHGTFLITTVESLKKD